MRILVLNWRDVTHPWAGGAEANIHEQAKCWVRAGHETTLFCAHYPGARREERIDGIRIVRRGGRFTVYFWAMLCYLFRFAREIDVILDIENGIPFFSPLYSRKPIVLLVHHIHQMQFGVEFGFPLRELGRWLEARAMPSLYRKVDCVTISETSRTSLVQLGVPHERICVVHPGLDHSRLWPGSRKAERPTIICLGRLKAYKRVHILLEILPGVLEKVPDTQVLIVGRGEMETRLAALARQLHVEDHVHFWGYVSEEERRRLLQEAWVCVAPSLNEGWGLCVIEANACGTPAIAFDVPGLSEAIQNPHTGFLVHTAQDLQDTTVRLLRDDSLRQGLSEAAIEWAGEFNWEKTAQATLSVLERQVEC